MQAVLYFVKYLVFPGFVFSAVVGLLTTWVDRKVTARVQLRVGPPWYQPFADTFKLLGKEVVVPAGARHTGFLVMPVVGLAAATLASTILWLVNLQPDELVRRRHDRHALHHDDPRDRAHHRRERVGQSARGARLGPRDEAPLRVRAPARDRGAHDDREGGELLVREDTDVSGIQRRHARERLGRARLHRHDILRAGEARLSPLRHPRGGDRDRGRHPHRVFGRAARHRPAQHGDHVSRRCRSSSSRCSGEA